MHAVTKQDFCAAKAGSLINPKIEGAKPSIKMRLIGGPLHRRIVQVPASITVRTGFECHRRSLLDQPSKKPKHRWYPVGTELFPNPYARNKSLIDGCVITQTCSYYTQAISFGDKDFLFYGSYDPNSKYKKKVRSVNWLDGSQRFEKDCRNLFGTGRDQDDGGHNSRGKSGSESGRFRFLGGPLHNKVFNHKDSLFVAKNYGYAPVRRNFLNKVVVFFLHKDATVEYVASRLFGAE